MNPLKQARFSDGESSVVVALSEEVSGFSVSLSSQTDSDCNATYRFKTKAEAEEYYIEEGRRMIKFGLPMTNETQF